MNSSNPIMCTILLCVFTLFASCKKEEVVTEFDCGEVETEIIDMSQSIGSYTSNLFTDIISSNFEEAAISIYIDNIRIITETETSCFSFIAIPQSIEKISITSLSSVTSEGLEYAPGEDLIGLFKLHNKEKTYTFLEFINAQNDVPLIFHAENDECILQLLNKPDISINQPLSIQLTFDDSKIFNLEIPTFEISN